MLEYRLGSSIETIEHSVLVLVYGTYAEAKEAKEARGSTALLSPKRYMYSQTTYGRETSKLQKPK